MAYYEAIDREAHNENRSRLPTSWTKFKREMCIIGRRYTLISKCVSAKSPMIRLPLSFAMNMIYYLPHSKYFSRSHIPQIAFYSTLTTIFGLSPLVGCLADIKFGRFKTVLATVLAVVVVVCSSIALLVARQITTGYRLLIEKATILPLIVVILVLYMVYDVNILHFSMDQLHESPADHQSLFLHWFVWLQNLMTFIGQVESRTEAHILDYLCLGNMAVAALVLGTVGLIAHCR